MDVLIGKLRRKGKKERKEGKEWNSYFIKGEYGRL